MSPSVMVLPKDSDIEEDDVPLAVRVRAHVVLSDEDLSGSDVGARREEASSSRTRVEVTPTDGSQPEWSPHAHAAEASDPTKDSAPLHWVKRMHWVLVDR